MTGKYYRDDLTEEQEKFLDECCEELEKEV